MNNLISQRSVGQKGENLEIAKDFKIPKKYKLDVKQTKRNRTAEADREGSSIIYQIFSALKSKGLIFLAVPLKS